MPTASPAHVAGATLTLAEQAQALAAYIQQRFRRFSSEDAAFVVSDVAPATGDIKELAGKLKSALKSRGFAVKHDAALNAAARIQGFPSWHEARNALVANGLVVTWWTREGKPKQVFSDWADLSAALADFCEHWLATQGGRAFQVHVGTNKLSVTVPAQEIAGDDFGRRPLAGVVSQEWTGDWAAGAVTALEHLRRRLEETGKAILDGFAVAQLCQANAPTNFLGGSAADARNSELVLREELSLGGHVEIARGDEMACWSELDLVVPPQDAPACEPDGTWSLAGRRFTWHIQTTNSLQSSVVLATVPLRPEQSSRLLRRYRKARDIFQGRLLRYEPHKDLAYFEAVPEIIGIDLDELLARMERQGLTWADYCKECGRAVEKSSALPRDFLFGLLKRLDTTDPDNVLLEPDRGSMSLVESDEMLSHLMPRIGTVRYRLHASATAQQRHLLAAAVAAFEKASIDMQLNAEEHMLGEAERLPHSNFSRRAGELRACVAETGMDLYAGVMWHLEPNDSRARDYDLPGADMWPYGISLALLLEIARD